MCDLFGSNGAAGAAQAQTAAIQQQQAKHNQAVKQDTSEINSAFAPFNSDYYNNFTNAYEANQNPQLDYQYGRAQGTLESQLAGNDQLDGSTGARALADLNQTYNGERATIANNAVDATNQLKSTVNNSENSLYSLAQQAVDPLTLESQAQNTAGAIVAPQSYPTIGSVFAGALQPVAGSLKTAQGSLGSQAAGNIGGVGSANPALAGVGGSSGGVS